MYACPKSEAWHQILNHIFIYMVAGVTINIHLYLVHLLLWEEELSYIMDALFDWKLLERQKQELLRFFMEDK